MPSRTRRAGSLRPGTENSRELQTALSPVPEAKESFGEWIDEMLQSMHRQGYRAPDIRRVYIRKPGKQEKRPLSVPCVADRALQRSVAQVLSAIYEQDFLPCSFGGRPGRGAHQGLATLHEVIFRPESGMSSGGGELWIPLHNAALFMK